MPIREGPRERGRHEATAQCARIGRELREARRAAGISQELVAKASATSQSRISRTERGTGRGLTVESLSVHCAVLGLRLSVKAYPHGSPVRDAAHLLLLGRLRAVIGKRYSWRPEAPISGRHDLRAWDVLLTGVTSIGVDAETHLYDLQALQRRTELKWRDSGVERVVLLVMDTRHNRRVLREHAGSLAPTFPVGPSAALAHLAAGRDHGGNGIVIL
ncbi:hypothetical protein BH23CHL8_BH23CHL8_01360 [soil metagenome]